jgi:radical SAM-linked protein
LAIESDLRFLSHRDTVRAVERAAARAHLPVKYTQGFNPHPVLSLADLAVMQLTRPMPAETLLGLLNAQAPGGMTFTRAEVLQAKAPPRVRRVDYDAPIEQAGQAQLADLAAKFNQADAWPVERGADRSAQGARGPAKAHRARTIDLKALVRDLRLEDGRLRFSLASDGQVWARPGEVLEAVGLDARADLARLVRMNVRYDL